MPTERKVSVALASYNGARYLDEQLESIAGQSSWPDELVISDDASTDDTLEVARRFARTAPFEVQVIANRDNVGYSRNFERALKSCTGGLIFLSDQDDIWSRDKVARVQKERLLHPESLLVMSDAEIVDKDGNSSGETVLGNMRKLGYRSEAFVKGCCMAVDRSLLDVALPLSDLSAYDNWISTLAERLQSKRVISDVLLQYRTHEGNASGFLTGENGPTNRRGRAQLEATVDPRGHLEARSKKVEAVAARLRERASSPPPPLTSEQFARALDVSSEELKVVADRADLLQTARMKRVIPATSMLLGGRYRYFSGVASYAKDLLRS